MAGGSAPKDRKMRHLIALEAARIMAETGLTDFYAAKRKAAATLGAPDTRNMPRNTEIEEALQAHLRLFRGETQPGHLQHLRQVAVQAMRLLAPFSPRLVGPVLQGTADEHSPVNLHLFADTLEDVALFLMQHEIPHEISDRRVRYSNGVTASFPVYRFVAGDAALELTVFPTDGVRQAPLSPVDGRPMRRAGLGAVEELLQS